MESDEANAGNLENEEDELKTKEVLGRPSVVAGMTNKFEENLTSSVGTEGCVVADEDFVEYGRSSNP